MTSTAGSKTKTRKQAAKRGGLPEEDGLADAFTAAAAEAFPATARTRRRPAAQPPAEVQPPDDEATATEAPASTPDVDSDPGSDSTTEAGATEPTPTAPPTPQLDPATQPSPLPTATGGSHTVACTIMVSTEVQQRFSAYQSDQKSRHGNEPTNAVVVRRAVLHAKRHDLFPELLEQVRSRQQPLQDEDRDDEGLFGDVPTRRTERGRTKDSVQQSFRPSQHELAVIDALWQHHFFPSRSDFLNATLEAFFPKKASKKK